MEEILNKALEKWGFGVQIDLAIEECSELITELSRIQRGRNEIQDITVIEEIVDAELCIEQLKLMTEREDYEVIKKEKIERLEDRLD